MADSRFPSGASSVRDGSGPTPNSSRASILKRPVTTAKALEQAASMERMTDALASWADEHDGGVATLSCRLSSELP